MTEKITPKKGDAVTVWEVVECRPLRGPTVVRLLSREGICTGKMVKFTRESRALWSGAHESVTGGHGVTVHADALCFTAEDAIAAWRAKCEADLDRKRAAYERAQALVVAEIVCSSTDSEAAP